MLKAINLSLSSACGADCIFCPRNRGQRTKQKIMPYEYAEKIINEAAEFPINKVSIGENGDAFQNKDIIKILRLIKLKLPQAQVFLFTNFQNFIPDKIDVILEEKLVTVFCCNIDGSNEENYFRMKKLDYKNTMNNLTYFLKARKRFKYHPPLSVYILTFHRYLHTVRNRLGFYPAKLRNVAEAKKLLKIPDDFLIIKKQLKKILLPTDKIYQIRPYVWAEREQYIEKYGTDKINYKKYKCPMFESLEDHAYIAPDGSWYMCCLDANTEIILGNVIETSLREIYLSEKRKTLIKMLENREYDKIGGPCRTVNCCQYLDKDKLEQIRFGIKKKLPKIKSALKTFLPASIFNIFFKIYKKLRT